MRRFGGKVPFRLEFELVVCNANRVLVEENLQLHIILAATLLRNSP